MDQLDRQRNIRGLMRKRLSLMKGDKVVEELEESSNLLLLKKARQIYSH